MESDCPSHAIVTGNLATLVWGWEIMKLLTRKPRVGETTPPGAREENILGHGMGQERTVCIELAQYLQNQRSLRRSCSAGDKRPLGVTRIRPGRMVSSVGLERADGIIGQSSFW